jgi:hypothetical protein
MIESSLNLQLVTSKRTRFIPYKSMFLNCDPDQALRPEWVPVYMAFARNRFRIEYLITAGEGHTAKDDIVDRLGGSIERLADWCDDNAKGFWSCSANDDEFSGTTYLYDGQQIEVNMEIMFELEEELEHFISQFILVEKLAG